MNGSELIALALRSRELRKTFRGVFARDSFIGLGQDDVTGAFLVNSSDRGTAGSHWLAVFIHQDHDGVRTCTFFDSLGREPRSYGINSIPGTKPGARYRQVYNTNRFQMETTDSCGIFCLFVLHWLSHRVQFDCILNSFSTKFLHENEKRVKDFAVSLKSGIYE